MTYENAVPSSCIIPTFVVTFLSDVTNMKFPLLLKLFKSLEACNVAMPAGE